MTSLNRTLYDVAQILESAGASEARVVRVLQRLHALVPYDECAALVAMPGEEPRLLAVPEAPPADRPALLARVTALLGRITTGHEHRPAAIAEVTGMHLAVPLVGLDKVVGVLFVRGATHGGYRERHLRALSVVAAQLGAYLSMVRANALEAERARQLDEARQVAEAARSAKDELVALVSHELRTPLTAILSWAGVLRSPQAPEAERTRALDAIERSVRAEVRLVDDLLDLSSVAAASLRLEPRPVAAAALIEDAVLALRPRAERRGIRLTVVLDRAMPPLVADPQRLNQIVVNLVANAVKFTPDGGRVEVHLERVGEQARIRVVDNGSGIRAEVLPHLFEPFRQADSSSTREHAGLGLGLVLVKELVELHGGHVEAQSAGQAQGAVFTVDLPLAGMDLATRPATEGDGASRTLAGIRVLVAEADADIRDVLRLMLEKQGAVVTVAGSAAEALLSLERAAPDVLVSDVVLPGESGYDLMRRIVARGGTHVIPAAALSAGAPGQGLAEAVACGFRVQLTKPIQPTALVTAVATLAGRTGHPLDIALPRPAPPVRPLQGASS